MCTCAAYTPVAEATCQLIDRYWQDHPELFIVGGDDILDRSAIPFLSDEKDWIGMALEAVKWLHQRGFTHCYLILDDHPPVGPCSKKYLNQTLPVLADKCGASHVALAGWDQFQPKDGTIVSVGSQRWMKNNIAFKWKFDLHPGFWNISDLLVILEQIINVSPRLYSAREFEGVAGSGALSLSTKLVASTYKIEGDRNTHGLSWYNSRLSRRGILYSLHALRIAARLGGAGMLRKIDSKTEIYTQYINGPYPMYWSGVIKKGDLNRNLIQFAEFTNNHDLISWLDSFTWRS